ncbi:glycosyltransferase family 8 protein [uncultured Mucilaginibacter sp.]|uniref:glycosyltransferase family 8 protein n=1 Tax=uncultured Mucilaginibacter sp. TaxID=797541 RepID=UPI0025EBFC35|nr:glycosyltransferase family 8 protein [uncultured Mucilaginibacter sp.]
MPNLVSKPLNTHSIAVTFDDNYMQHACVMLQSLNTFLHNDVKVYCIYNNLKENNRQLLKKHFAGSQIKLEFIEFDKAVLPLLPIKENDHVSEAAFFRIWLPYLLPEEKQVLFLDTDLVINGDISPLLQLDISACALAAIPDSMSEEKKATLGIPPTSYYFNSGVMLMNLVYFRQHKLTQKLSEFIANFPQLCEFWDQDAFNGVIKGDFYVLEPKYNAQSWHFEQNCNAGFTEVATNQTIVHFTGAGPNKPWLFHNQHPLKKLYYHYLVKTPFANYIPPDIPRSWRIFRVIRFMIYKYLS